jgi:hypothetical protein
LASAYGRSVPVTSATVNTTNSTTGSVMAAKAITKLASARMNPPPRMPPM